MRTSVVARPLIAVVVSVLLAACGSDTNITNPNNNVGETGGGQSDTGGASSSAGGAPTGGNSAAGGVTSSGGSSTGGSSASGGAPAGGAPTGGSQAAGGAPTGGASQTGGAATGGSSPGVGGSGAGGAATGGSNAAGGNATGGKATGGAAVGGAATGGKAAGGSSTTGGSSSATGGTTTTGGSTAATGGKATGGAAPTGGTAATGGTSSSSTAPCDIFAAASTPCAAAHSTIRAMFGAYSGKLYRIRNAAGTQVDINTASAGGFADSAAQDTFCSGTTCVLLYIYDQTGHGIDLTWQGTDSPVSGIAGHSPATITRESLNVSGHKVYSTYINASQAYWVDGSSKGMPKGNSAQGIYMVTSGTHVNGLCCFDYGNGETTRAVGSCGSMDAMYFGTSCWFGGCSGTGPWVEHDPECGIYPGGSSSWPSTQKAFTSTYVTAMMKNNGTTLVLKGANAASGALSTVFSGKPAFTPNKQGALVLGSGGDCCYSNNNASVGTFYEGAIIAGYPSDATDDAVQANVVAAKYGQ